MFADTLKHGDAHRTGINRRSLLHGAALLAATSSLPLGLGAVETIVAAKSRSRKNASGKSHQQNKKAGREANVESGQGNAEKQVEADKQGGKTVTRTFSSSNAVVINDDAVADPYPATIQVSGFKKGKVVDVNVILRGLNHTFPDNIDVVLVAPTGASTVLMSDAGGATDAENLTLRIDDEAADALPDSTALTSGGYRPANYGAADTYPSLAVPPETAALSLIDGVNPNGEWRLHVVDDAAANVGALSGGWDLELTVKLAGKKRKKGGKKGGKK